MTAPVPSAERWVIRLEFEDVPDVETAVGQSATSATNAIMGLLNDRDLWPDRVEVQRLPASLRVNGDTQ